MKFGIGQHVQRVEDLRLLRGEGAYVDDHRLPGQAHAALLRSPVAHGRIVSVTLGPARQLPGVLLAWSHRELGDTLHPMGSEVPLRHEIANVSVTHLASDKVRYVGQPIAFVVAETRAAAEDAVEAIDVEIEELPAVTDPVAALEDGAPGLHDAAPGNLAYRFECGDRAATDAAFAHAARIIRVPVVNQRIVVSSIEPRAINVAYHDDTRRWEAWCSSQGVFGMRAKLSKALRVEAEKIRVHTGDVGGAFGMKLMDHPEYALCALAARQIRRPVKWIGSRSESFLSDAQGRDMQGEVEGAFDADGRCRAMRMRTVSGIGAHFSTAGAAVHTIFSAPLLGGLYGIEAMHAEVRGAFLNTPPTDAYRGAGRPETIYATERLMEAGARAFGMDRAAFRRMNLLSTDQLPHPSPGGLTFDSLDCARVLDRALAAADYEGFEARAAAAEARGMRRGIGVTYYFERTGGGPVEHTRFDFQGSDASDMVLEIRIGTQASGQGHETAWAQIAHETLGLPLERIRVMPGDSDSLKGGGGTGGSRSTIKAGQVLPIAAERLVETARPHAAEMLEAAEGDLDYEPATASFRIAGTDRVVSLAAVAAVAAEAADTGGAGGLAAEAEVNEANNTYPNGCHICEVEIDPETGRAEVLRYTIVDDFGRMINPMLVEGQVHGGVVQGLGQVFGEAARWDAETGQPVTGSFMDYALPRAGDVPFFALDFEEVPTPTNPLGVKGCGEAGSVGGIPAGALAVLDALWRAGVRTPLETPYTPLKLWQALHDASRQDLAAE
ncbi:MAG: xanthine dehydrogenase family protein molybdopterin-binding subunit [Pseudomonadota bacterium]